MDTRKEDIKTLQEMQSIQRELKNISQGLKRLDEIEDNVTVDENQYRMTNAIECEENKEKAITESFDVFIKKQKAATAKFSFAPWVGLAAGIAVIILSKEIAWLGMILFVLGFVIKGIASSVISKQISKEQDAAISKIEAEYKTKLEKAKEEDEEEENRYYNDLEIAREKCREHNKAAREKLENQQKEYENNLDKIRVISDDDMKNIPALIKILEGNRADNIKEALLVMDEQKRQEKEAEERRRREEAEEKRRRKAEEEARLATMPGTVHIRIGSINTYSGNLQTVRNAIYFDGALYGAGDANGTTTFQLNPGAHNVYAQLQEAGYIFTSPNQTFTLPGNGHVYLKVMIKNARAVISLCSSESDFWSN
ncbi:MAG: hypothetical protein IIU77_00410 [Clostridia bacterium]|nr:hypothetical protein [Clostridia bacterium]